MTSTIRFGVNPVSNGLSGVVATDYDLSGLQSFLDRISPTSGIFLIDRRNGLLIGAKILGTPNVMAPDPGCTPLVRSIFDVPAVVTKMEPFVQRFGSTFYKTITYWSGDFYEASGNLYLAEMGSVRGYSGANMLLLVLQPKYTFMRSLELSTIRSLAIAVLSLGVCMIGFVSSLFN